jgi:hypothetical protein
MINSNFAIDLSRSLINCNWLTTHNQDLSKVENCINGAYNYPTCYDFMTEKGCCSTWLSWEVSYFDCLNTAYQNCFDFNGKASANYGRKIWSTEYFVKHIYLVSRGFSPATRKHLLRLLVHRRQPQVKIQPPRQPSPNSALKRLHMGHRPPLHRMQKFPSIREPDIS